MRLVYNILRYTAWLLIPATVLELLSGFAVRKYYLFPWLGYETARFLHGKFFLLIFILLFYLHSLGGILILFTRHKFLNRKIFKMSAGALWTIIFLTFGYLYAARDFIPPTVVEPGATPPPGAETVTLTLSEIAQHNSASDCWIILDNKVYNVTSYLDAHPGTPAAIIPSCGKDGTQAFATKGNRGRPHSAYASSLHPAYYLGDVGATTTTQTIDNVKNQPAPSDGENEDD